MRLIIVSNRLPFTVSFKDGAPEFKPSAGGLTTGLWSYLERKPADGAERPEFLWMGWPGASVPPEHQAAAVAGIADAAGNAGQPGHQGGFEGVLKKNGAVKMFAAQSPPLAELGAEGSGGVEDHAVGEGLARVEFRDPGFGQHGDAGVGEARADGVQRGERHDGVADPIGGADEDV